MNDKKTVRPGTGTVFWVGQESNKDINSLEFTYLYPEEICPRKGEFHWDSFEKNLEQIKANNHQALVRISAEKPGKTPKIPSYISQDGNFRPITNDTLDWRSIELQEFYMEMISRLAEKYDGDNRIFLIQGFFGYWSEGHISGTQLKIGINYPSKEFQNRFYKHVANSFKITHIGVSISYADTYYCEAPVDLPFGFYSDSAWAEKYYPWNKILMDKLGWYESRWKTNVLGGEAAYHPAVQEGLLNKNGPEGTPTIELLKRDRMSYILANSQFSKTNDTGMTQEEALKKLSLEFGYAYKIKMLNKYSLEVSNTGIAPPYYDHFVQSGSETHSTSLKGLLPEQTVQLTFSQPLENLKITSPNILPTQTIDFHLEEALIHPPEVVIEIQEEIPEVLMEDLSKENDLQNIIHHEMDSYMDTFVDKTCDQLLRRISQEIEMCDSFAKKISDEIMVNVKNLTLKLE